MENFRKWRIKEKVYGYNWRGSRKNRHNGMIYWSLLQTKQFWALPVMFWLLIKPTLHIFKGITCFLGILLSFWVWKSLIWSFLLLSNFKLINFRQKKKCDLGNEMVIQVVLFWNLLYFFVKPETFQKKFRHTELCNYRISSEYHGCSGYK